MAYWLIGRGWIMPDFVMDRFAPAPALVVPVGGGSWLRWVIGDDKVHLMDRWGRRIASRVPFWWESDPMSVDQALRFMNAWSEEIFEDERVGLHSWA